MKRSSCVTPCAAGGLLLIGRAPRFFRLAAIGFVATGLQATTPAAWADATNPAGSTFTIADGQNLIEPGNFTNNGTLRVIASPGTAPTSFTVEGALTNIVNGTLTAPVYPGFDMIVPANYEIRSAPGLSATLRVTGADVFRIGPTTSSNSAVNLTLAGVDARFVDQNGLSALRNFTGIMGARSSLQIADGHYLKTPGDFSNLGRLIVAAAPGTNTTFEVSGKLIGLSSDGTVLDPPPGTGGNSVTYAIEAQPSGTATVQIPGIDVVALGVAIKLGGVGSRIVDANGNDALRNLQRLAGGPVSGATGRKGTLQLSNGRIFLTPGGFSNGGDLIVDSSVAGAASRFTSSGALAEFSNNTLSGGTYTVVARNGGTATLQFPDANVATVGIETYITLSGPEARLVDQNGADALRSLTTNNGSISFAEGHNFSTIGSITNRNFLGVSSAGPLVGIRETPDFFGGPAATTTLTISGNLLLAGAVTPGGGNGNLSVVSANGGIARAIVNGQLTNDHQIGMQVRQDGGEASLLVNGALTNFNFASRTLAGGRYILTNSTPTGSIRIQFPGADIVVNNATIFYTGSAARPLGSIFADGVGNDGLRNLAFNGPAGTLDLTGAPFTAVGSFANEGKMAARKNADVSLPAGATFTNQGAGVVRLEAGGTLATGMYQQSGGTTTLANGKITASDFYEQTAGETIFSFGYGVGVGELIVAEARFLGGTLRGIGTINGNVFNNATLAPSFVYAAGIPPGFDDDREDDIGSIVVTGNLTLGSSSRFETDIGDLVDFDFLDVSGAVTLGGNLFLHLSYGLVPGPADQFAIINAAGGISGAFDNVPNGGRLALTDGSGSFRVNYGSGAFLNKVVLSDFQGGPVVNPARLLNIATRLRVQEGENVLIGGFIITGTDPKKVVIRGIGPSLAQFFNGTLADPTLQLFQGNTPLASNNDWREAEAEIAATGIPPSHDKESAIVRTLAPGNYTAILGGNGGSTGIGVVEVYDLDQNANSQLANIASRGFVDIGDNVMIGGLIVGPAGGASARVVVRAIGPTLGNFGIAGALQDPTLELVNSNGVVLRGNNNWTDTQQTEIEATGLQPGDNRESALIETLAPGNYTAIVRGAGNTTGVGLVEVYNVE